jgi:hypothetical protein
MTRHNNRRLTGILLSLIGIFIVIRLLSPKSESNIAKEFAVLDTASIRDVKFLEKGEVKKETRLTRNKDGWKITSENRQGWAAEDLVDELLESISVVRIDRLAGSEKSSWNKLYVSDTLGTRITVSGEDKLMADWHIGSPPQNGSSFIRSENENKVYVLENNELASLTKKSLDNWLDKRLIKFQNEKINRIDFNYPSDSSFTIIKSDSTWTIEYQEVEASVIDNYLNNVLRQNISSFAADSVRKMHPDITIKFTDRNNSTASIKGWKHKDSWIVTSSYQLTNYFLIPETTMQKDILLSSKELELNK